MSQTESAGVYRAKAAVRAAIVVTGTEVLTGHVTDRNGPWLSAALSALGVEVATIAIVGDRPDDLRHVLDQLGQDDLAVIITSGGLGPTADDLTAAVVGEFCGRDLLERPDLTAQIVEILEQSRRGGSRGATGDGQSGAESLSEAQLMGAEKQATLPEGAVALTPQGTAPGFMVSVGADGGERSPLVVVLPGPPGELRGMGPEVVGSSEFRSAIADAVTIDEHMVRMFGVSEATIVETLNDAQTAGIELTKLEITTCLRDGELEVSTRVPVGAESVYGEFERFVLDRHGAEVFSVDEGTIDDQVARLLARGLTIAVAESCTGGMLGARLTARAGASDYVLGGAIVYSNEAKSELAAVPAATIERCGAVSDEVAVALATGIRSRLNADIGVGISGIAGPGGGSAAKPVGTVCLAVAMRSGERVSRIVHLPGDRETVRQRATTVAMHMIAEALGA